MLHVLRRHPLPVAAHFRHSLVLAYAFPREQLAPLLPPGLVLDAHGDHALGAVAIVDTAALRPRGPYPILCLHGTQGSGKSTTARRLRSLIDPNAAPLRGLPRSADDIIQMARRLPSLSSALALNNVWARTFCRMMSLSASVRTTGSAKPLTIQ